MIERSMTATRLFSSFGSLATAAKDDGAGTSKYQNGIYMEYEGPNDLNESRGLQYRREQISNGILPCALNLLHQSSHLSTAYGGQDRSSPAQAQAESLPIKIRFQHMQAHSYTHRPSIHLSTVANYHRPSSKINSNEKARPLDGLTGRGLAKSQARGATTPVKLWYLIKSQSAHQ